MAAPPRRRILKFAVAATVPLASGCAVQESVFGEDVPGGHLFVRNRLDEEARVALVVTDRAGESDQVINGVYEIPESHVLQFEEVLESGNTYELLVRQPGFEGLGEQRQSVTVETCEEGDPSDKLDVLVLVTDHGPDVTTYNCDEVYSRNEELTYVEPGEYWVGTATATPTPES